MWHVCEEAWGRGTCWRPGAPDEDRVAFREATWRQALLDHTRGLCQRYPTSQEQISHWYNVCRTTYPVYQDWWSMHPDVTARQVLMPETVFDVPYSLPGGRVVRLRGRRDSVDLIGRGSDAGTYVQENKTKGDVKPEQLRRQLTFDLQTMLYVVAFMEELVTSVPGTVAPEGVPFKGVIYNVVRRPLSGGRGSIVKHKPTKKNPLGESDAEYDGRLADILAGAHGSDWGCNAGEHHFFQRWKVEVSPQDIDRFKREFLDPCLENLCYWYDVKSYEFTTGGSYNYMDPGRYGPPPVHWRHPFGVYNVLDEGGSSDLDAYLATGSTAGLVRTNEMFPELQDG
jgi:hypothetical protein